MPTATSIRSLLSALLLCLISSSSSQAQVFQNVSPAADPQGPTSFKSQRAVIVTGTTKPAAYFYTIQGDWMQQGAGYFTIQDGFTTEPTLPVGSSTVTAPIFDPGTPNKIYNITVKAYKMGQSQPTDTKNIRIKVTAP